MLSLFFDCCADPFIVSLCSAGSDPVGCESVLAVSI